MIIKFETVISKEEIRKDMIADVTGYSISFNKNGGNTICVQIRKGNYQSEISCGLDTISKCYAMNDDGKTIEVIK